MNENIPITTSGHIKKAFFIFITILFLVIIVAAVLYGQNNQHTVTYEQVQTPEPEQQMEESDLPPAEIVLAPQTVSFADGTEATFSLAEPYKLAVAAEEIGKARFIAQSPDGRLFIPDLVDYQLSREGKIYILGGFNEETKRFETKEEYLTNLRGPNSAAFYTDESGQHWFYLALTAHLVRYPYELGDTAPSGEPEIILEFPNTQAPEAKSVVWHITRTIEFKDDRLYISIGSGCNSCEQPEGDMRAMIASINPDGSDMEVYADGLRNAVGFTWMGDTLVATENGADHLGTVPEELVYKLEKGEHYGWPYCYERDDEVVEDDSVAWTDPVACEDVPHSFASFAPRSAPLGIEYFEEGGQVLKNTFLAALHGSFAPETRNGYEIVRITEDGQTDVFMDNFQLENGERIARPVDFFEKDEKSFFFTDDFGGRLFYVYEE